MIFDLFSSADYCYSKLGVLNNLVWILGFIWLFWKMNLFFYSLNRLSQFFSILLSWHYEKMKSSSMSKMKGSYMIMGGSFFLILGSKIWGLFPYIFGLTTQMVLTFSASWVLWLSMVWSSGELSMFKFFASFTPSGSPGYLAPILSMMEMVSNIIRPLTLSLRLSMNMTTGHVFLNLMGVGSNVILILVILMWGYILFEMGMGFIQGFVFSLLTAQYLGEHV